MILSPEEIEKIRQAVEIERKYQYINIKGKECTFSRFIISQLRKIHKLTKRDSKWAVLIEYFEHYEMSAMLSRKKMVENFIKNLNELNHPDLKTVNKKSENRIETTDVTYLKGVGPKVAYLFNKVGIYTIFDLLHYYPVKYINYSSRVPIKQLRENERCSDCILHF